MSVVDKKGVLSWPNPQPEKAFLLRVAGEGQAIPGYPSRRESVYHPSMEPSSHSTICLLNFAFVGIQYKMVITQRV